MVRPASDVIRVLHLSRDFPPRRTGGLSTAVGDMVQTLAELGTECAVVSFDRWRPRRRVAKGELLLETRHGARIARVNGPGALDPALEFGREFSPTIIHVHHSMLWSAAAELRRELSVPVVASVHVAQAHQNRLRGIERTASSDAQQVELSQADAVIAPSPAVARILLAADPTLAPRLSVIPLGARDTARARAAAAAPEKRDSGLILYAGRFADINGTEEMLLALPQILGRFPRATAVLAGGLPENRRAEARWLQRWRDRAPDDLAGRVHFPGWLEPDDLSELYARCAVLVSPSWFETFGLVVLEAMLHGAPIAAARSGGVESMVRDRDSGVLLSPRDSAAIAHATCAILDDRELAQELGERAAHRARSSFLWPAIAPQLCELYESLTCSDRIA